MTDKEEIIIDGVNVGQCKYLNTFTDCDGYHYYCDLADDIKNEYCEHYKNCYFKQLARNTQECEEIKEEYEALKLENKELYRILADLKEVRKLKDKYKQECEELKKDLQDYESWFDEYKILFTYDGRTPVTNDELYTCLEELVKKGNNETNRYRKALEEIEQELKEDIYCESQECGCDDFEECLKCTKEHILDIINEAKENNQ